MNIYYIGQNTFIMLQRFLMNLGKKYGIFHKYVKHVTLKTGVMAAENPALPLLE